MAERQPRLTPQRQAVLKVVREARDHPTANEILQRVRQIHPTIAYGTVYSALHTLVQMGMIHELRFDEGASRYDGRLEPHHHALCLGCGAVAEVEIALPRDQWQEAVTQSGFDLANYQLQFTGYCPRCRGNNGREMS